MAPSLGRFYFTRATCVTGWMMRLQHGTERARNWRTPQWMAAEIQRGTERARNWRTPQWMAAEIQRGTERARNWRTPQWMAAEIQRGTQNGAQLAYLDAW